MNFDALTLKHLKGEDFSNRFHLKTSTGNDKSPDRNSFLKKLVENFDVIHLGCADHKNLIESKVKEGTWLHAILSQSAKRCLGVDINQDCMEYISKKYSYSDMVCADIFSSEPKEITGSNWNYIIIAEILEHLNNPHSSLKSLHEKYAHCIKKIVITAPNAFFYKNFRFALNNEEVINSDHRFWFTPFTLGKIVTEAGFKVTEYTFCDYASKLNKSWNYSVPLLKKFPTLRETLIMIAEF